MAPSRRSSGFREYMYAKWMPISLVGSSPEGFDVDVILYYRCQRQREPVTGGTWHNACPKLQVSGTRHVSGLKRASSHELRSTIVAS